MLMSVLRLTSDLFHRYRELMEKHTLNARVWCIEDFFCIDFNKTDLWASAWMRLCDALRLLFIVLCLWIIVILIASVWDGTQHKLFYSFNCTLLWHKHTRLLSVFFRTHLLLSSLSSLSLLFPLYVVRFISLRFVSFLFNLFEWFHSFL